MDPAEIFLDPGVDSGCLGATDIGHSVVNFLLSPVTGKEVLNSTATGKEVLNTTDYQ